MSFRITLPLVLSALTFAACVRRDEPVRAAPEPRPVAEAPVEPILAAIPEEADAVAVVVAAPRAPEPAPPAAVAPAKPVIAVAKPAPGPARTGALRVRRAVIGTAVEARTPRCVADTFGTDVGTLYAFIDVANPGEPTAVTMVWKRDGEAKSRIDLNLGHGKGWRTWSKKRIGRRDVGKWTVYVLTADGKTLHTIPFRVSGTETAFCSH